VLQSRFRSTETHDVKFLRQLRTSATTRNGGRYEACSREPPVVYQTLVSGSAHASLPYEGAVTFLWQTNIGQRLRRLAVRSGLLPSGLSSANERAECPAQVQTSA
jgi:hypothetical protein